MRHRPVAVLVCALALLPAAPAAAASTCGPQGVAITPLQTNVFYIDDALDYLGSYVGYAVENSGGDTKAGLWLRLEAFTGSVVAPADGGNVTAPLALDTLTAGAATPAYGYLKASAETLVAQTHDVVVYAGRPGAGGTEVCRETQTIVLVSDVIKAAANKVTGATVTGSPSLGGTFSITVNGNTGTIGAGPAADPGIVRFSPAVAANWPSSAFRLIDVQHRLPLAGAAIHDVLSRSDLDGLGDTPYDVTYTFRVVGPTTTTTPLNPVQNIASGTQVKHTDPDSLGGIPPVPTVTSSATASIAAGVTGPYDAGTPVPIDVTFTNAGGGPITLDEVVVTLPEGWTHETGSTTCDEQALDDPFVADDTLHIVGPFAVPGSSSLTCSVTVTAGSSGTAGAYGLLAGGQIDSTTAVDDDAPATVTLTVNGDTPPPPAPSPLTSSGVATAPQQVTITIPAGGTARLIATDDARVTHWNRPGVGLYVLDPETGVVTFTPVIGYTGSPVVAYEVTDAFDQTGESTYTATVTLPAPPAAAPRDSTGVGTAVQDATLPIPPGGTVTLLGLLGQPAAEVIVLGQGTYALDPLAGVVTFTPILGFSGQPTPVGYRLTDAYGQTDEDTYTPSVVPPAGPTATSQESTGGQSEAQAGVVTVPSGGSITLLDADGNPTDRVVIAGQGEYVLDTVQGVITFLPLPDFVGTPTPVVFVVTDAYGQAAEALYAPEVLGRSATSPAPSGGTRPATPAPAPAAKICASRRTMTIHWWVARGTRLARIDVTAGGRRVKRLSGKARTVTVDLRGRVRETVLVRVIGHVRGGGTVSTSRTYRPCRERLAQAPLKTLRLLPEDTRSG